MGAKKTLHSENMAEVPQLSGCWASLTRITRGAVSQAGRANELGRGLAGYMTCEDTTGMDKNGRNAFWEDLGGSVDEMQKRRCGLT